MSLLAHNAVSEAVKMAVRGIPVVFIPVGQKACTTPNWQNLGTTDTEEIIKRSGSGPMNYACIAKAVSGGFLFLDDDGGIRQEYEKAHGPMPATLKVRSCNGSFHYYFRHSAASLAYQASTGKAYTGEPNPDGKGELWSLRMHNSYVVGPGSSALNHQGIDSEYAIVWDAPIVEIPETLLRFLIERYEAKNRKVGTKQPLDLYAPIYEGSRNNELTRRAGKLHRAGLSEESILRELTVINDECCHPPLDSSEVKTIAHSIGSLPPDEGIDDVSNISIDGIWINGPLRGQRVPNYTPKAGLSLWDRATPFSEIADTPMEAIIPGLIAKGESTMMTGDFGSFKSYMTYFIADAVSEGGTFVKRAAQKHPVLVLDRENSKATISLRRYLVGNLRDKQNVRLLGRFTTPNAPEITNAELLELCRTIRPFVIIDSMQDFHAGKKENDVDDMTQFSLELNRLIDAGAVAVLIIHHVPKTGKGKGGKYRGATAIPGGVGGALFVEKIGRLSVKIEGFKTRDGEDSTIELLLRFPSEPEMKDKTGRVTYSVVRSGMDRVAELRSSILDYVRAAVNRNEAPSANEIAKALGGDRNEIYGLVKALKDEKQLVCTDAKKGRLELPQEPAV